MKINRAVFLNAFLILFLATSATFSAEIQIYPGANVTKEVLLSRKARCNDFTFDVRGELTSGDAKTLASAVKKVESFSENSPCSDKLMIMRINSDGGSVSAAIDLGRVVRKNGIYVAVPEGANCFSSCVLVLAAGADRFPAGKIGIHRPYFGDLSNQASLKEIRDRQNAVRNKIRAYLAEMDVSPTLLDLMLSIPPEDMRILDAQELTDLRLTGKDPSFDERQTAKMAKFWGLTSSEYRNRNQKAWSVCRLESGLIDDICHIQVMAKVSKAEAKRLYDAEGKCLHLPDPSDEAFYECRSNIYLNRGRR